MVFLKAENNIVKPNKIQRFANYFKNSVCVYISMK